VLVFPLIAISFALSTGADGAPTAALTPLAPGTAEWVEESGDGERCAKGPTPKSRVFPKKVSPRKTKGGSKAPRQAVRRAFRPQPAAPAPVVVLPLDSSPCPQGMVRVAAPFCIDVYEASLVEVLPDGQERPWPYFEQVPSDAVVRAVSVAGVYPQGYISGVKARDACERSDKRLCKPDEWRNACMGPRATVFPYGDVHEVGRCNDNGRSSMRFFNPELDSKPEHRWMWGYGGNMIDPRLNQLDGTLTRTGERSGCTNEYGVFDMVGNLHEWVDDPDGTFQGGYYLDTHMNGDGCYYRTTAHPMSHLDYSTGFRCCADVP
jgi:formylglycine-generating enzyme